MSLFKRANSRKRASSFFTSRDESLEPLTNYNIGQRAVASVLDSFDEYEWQTFPVLSFAGMKDVEFNLDSTIKSASVLVTGKLTTYSGVHRHFVVPLTVQNGQLGLPSVLQHDGQMEILAQSSVDQLAASGTFYQDLAFRHMYSPPYSQQELEGVRNIPEEYRRIPRFVPDRSMRQSRRIAQAQDFTNKKAWEAACTKAGATQFDSSSYPDVLALNARGESVGWWDGTDSTGSVYDRPHSPRNGSRRADHWSPKPFKHKDPVDVDTDTVFGEAVDPAEKDQHELLEGSSAKLSEATILKERGGAYWEYAKGTECTILKNVAGDGSQFLVEFEDGCRGQVPGTLLKKAQKETLPFCQICGKKLTQEDLQAYQAAGAPEGELPAVCEQCADQAAGEIHQGQMNVPIGGQAKGYVVEMLQSWRDALPKALETLGGEIEGQGYAQGSTQWGVLVWGPWRTKDELDTALRAELNFQGFLKVEPYVDLDYDDSEQVGSKQAQAGREGQTRRPFPKQAKRPDPGTKVGFFSELPESLAKQFPEGSAKTEVDDSPPHVTVAYIGDLDKALFGRVRAVAEKVAAETAPFEAKFANELTYFELGDEGIPVVLEINSEGFQKLNAKLKAALAAASVPYSKKWPRYRPHTIVTYLQPGEDYVGDIPKGSWIVNSFSVWGTGDPVVFKLTGHEVAKAAQFGTGWWVSSDGDLYDTGHLTHEEYARTNSRLFGVSASMDLEDLFTKIFSKGWLRVGSFGDIYVDMGDASQLPTAQQAVLELSNEGKLNADNRVVSSVWGQTEAGGVISSFEDFVTARSMYQLERQNRFGSFDGLDPVVSEIELMAQLGKHPVDIIQAIQKRYPEYAPEALKQAEAQGLLE